ncbi:MAG: hypothetical protein GKR88_14845 [Flavobacteriaceae bacterium]|nr:MAG: hypothetical protein GKR88_07975 [Flavobacteriaceae bacterium]QMU65434.1 MAG: hypothetical protein GKR88_14845 [Flavobacteriaceae bacterium]
MRAFLILLLSLISFNSYSQLDENTKAKLYFVEAEKQFNQNNYTQAIEYVEKAERELGAPNARTLNLKIKAFYNDGKFKKAEIALNLFINEHQKNATKKIKNETLSYFVRIEKSVEEQNKEAIRLAEQRKIKERERVARLEKERVKKERLKKISEDCSYVRCTNYCSSGKVTKTGTRTCQTCWGVGNLGYTKITSNGYGGLSGGTLKTCTGCYGKKRNSYL